MLRLWARSPESAARAARFFSTVTCDAAEAADGADLCVLCTPVGSMPEIARLIAPKLSAHATVTDAGSVKAQVVGELEKILGGRFIGSHPMAGSEQSGLNFARANLFEDAVCIITPTQRSEEAALKKIRELWQAVGARLVEMSPASHDATIARVSHLPHAVSAALVLAVHQGAPDALALAGGGYRDTTRIAAGPPSMWAEIFLENRTGLAAGLEDMKTQLDLMKQLILAGDAGALEALLTRAKDIRATLP